MLEFESLMPSKLDFSDFSRLAERLLLVRHRIRTSCSVRLDRQSLITPRVQRVLKVPSLIFQPYESASQAQSPSSVR